MGGGVGISQPAKFRVATENTRYAMPETGIGLFPDVGGGYFLARCPGEIGVYLALTGARIKTADAIHCGVGDIVVPQAKLDEIEAALAAADLGPGLPAIDAILARHAVEPGTPSLAAHRALIDRHFSHTTVEAILASLDSDADPFAEEAARTIRMKSPTSCKIALRQIRFGRNLTMDENMRMEWRIAHRVIKGHDFYEGVRAVIVDKDNAPNWRPARFEEVSDAAIDAYFAPLGEEELRYPWERA